MSKCPSNSREIPSSLLPHQSVMDRSAAVPMTVPAILPLCVTPSLSPHLIQGNAPERTIQDEWFELWFMFLNKLAMWSNCIFTYLVKEKVRVMKNKKREFETVARKAMTVDIMPFRFGFNRCVWFRLWHFEMPLVLKSHSKLYALMLPNCSQM